MASALVVAGLGACGEPSESDPGFAYGDYPARLAAAWCEAIVPCCAEFGLQHDRAACVALFEPAWQSLYSHARAAVVRFDAAAAEACLTALDSGGTQCDANSSDPICAGVTHGLLQPGETCESTLECDAAADAAVECDGLTKEGTPVCIVSPPAAEGDDCAKTCDTDVGLCFTVVADPGPVQPSCWGSDGLHCQDGVCRQRGAPGAACIVDVDCETEAYCCQSESSCQASSCVSRIAAGGTCAAGTKCVAGLGCHGGACVPELGAGEPCDPADDRCSGACEGGKCRNVPNLAEALTCIAPP